MFHPLAQPARLARGQVLQVALRAPTLETAKHGDAPVFDAVVTHDERTGDVAPGSGAARPQQVRQRQGIRPGRVGAVVPPCRTVEAIALQRDGGRPGDRDPARPGPPPPSGHGDQGSVLSRGTRPSPGGRLWPWPTPPLHDGTPGRGRLRAAPASACPRKPARLPGRRGKSSHARVGICVLDVHGTGHPGSLGWHEQAPGARESARRRT